MKLLIGVVILTLMLFIIFAIGIIVGVAIIQAKEEMDNDRH